MVVRMRFFAVSGLLLALLVPAGAYAVNVVTLNLRQGQTNAKWEVFKEVQVSRRPDGLLLTAGTETGVLISTVSFSDIANESINYDGFPHAVMLVTDASSQQRIAFGWHNEGNPPDVISTMPITVAAGADIASYGLLHRQSNWEPTVDRIAILVPPGATVLLKEVTFLRWSIAEKLANTFLSIFSFDEYRMYAINFVWGPRLAWNPLYRELIWDYLPPYGASGTYILNILLVVAIAGLFFMVYRSKDSMHHKRKTWIKRSAMLLFAAWILFDARMGSELLTWFGHDYKTYISAPEGMKSLRRFNRFFDFAEFVKPFVEDRKSYVLFTPREYPDVPDMRYVTYPSTPGQALEDDTWVIYERSDITVIDDRIVVNGQVASGTGIILGQFDETSFVFRVNP